MKNRLLGFAALGFLLIAFVLALAPVVRAGGVDDKIQALENELGRLKSEQMELKKEATAAAAALPDFSYRPGAGVTVQAADKSWSFALSHETHFMMPFESGKDQAGRTNGEVMGRRFRQEWTLCLNNCFYEWISRLDLDGFGTQTDLQRGMLNVHFEQLNPLLPTFYIGMEIPSRVATPFRQDSSATGAQMEYDLMSRNNGFNTGRTGQGFGLVWEELPFFGIGRSDASIVIGAQGTSEDGERRFTDKKDVMLYYRVDPFSRIKNPWLSGFSYSIGLYICRNDDRANSDNDVDGDNDINAACTRNRVQDHGPGGRQTLFDSGEDTMGRGVATFISTGIRWKYATYTLRVIGGFQNYTNRSTATTCAAAANPNPVCTIGPLAANAAGAGVDQEARNFLIGHDLYVWSPKGLLTGSSSTPGSLLAGYHFERNDYRCGHTRGAAMCAVGAQFSRNRIIVNEWDLWYFFMSGKSLGISTLWYDASNLRTKTTAAGAGSVYQNLKGTSDFKRAGIGGDWVDVILGLRMNF